MLKTKLLSAMGGAEPNYIEDVFSTWLYTGNGSTQTINNGIDLAGEGGLWWGKQRDSTGRHWLLDSARGGNILSTNLTDAQIAAFVSSPFTSTGISFTSANSIYNGNGNTYVGWTFRKQPKFFDVVTYTGDGVAGRTVAHNLGSVPGCIIVKRTDTATDWQVYHTSLGTNGVIKLNSTDAAATSLAMWNNTAPTSTVFSVGTPFAVNESGGTYVAYLFAHNAGGFGLTGTDNVISCGSYTTTGSEIEINLGYEPQLVILKAASATGSWAMIDNMRGFSQTNTAYLYSNLSNAESNYTGSDNDKPTATGFKTTAGGVGTTYIYIAIRRGPMKVPTTGTSVFSPILQAPSTYGVKLNAGFPVSLLISGMMDGTGVPQYVEDRLRGVNTTQNDSGEFPYLSTSTTAAEVQQTWGLTQGWDNTGFYQRSLLGVNIVSWAFQRAPGFFDEVCYTGTGSARTVAHNLAAVPELMIVKGRSYGPDWRVYHTAIGATAAPAINLDTTPFVSDSYWNDTAPTSTVFTVATNTSVNTNGQTYVAYLFATCPGVSKVFSYTGNGTSQTINCGFTGGARFILIKRTDDTGDWYVWDTARGIVSGNDPHLSLNTTAAEVTTDDSIDTDSTGFIVNQLSATNINVTSATYIGLAIA